MNNAGPRRARINRRREARRSVFMRYDSRANFFYQCDGVLRQ